jgi:hypothetical protein
VIYPDWLMIPSSVGSGEPYYVESISLSFEQADFSLSVVDDVLSLDFDDGTITLEVC